MMKILRVFDLILSNAQPWLEEREVLRCEMAVLSALECKPWRRGQRLDGGLTAAQLSLNHAERLEGWRGSRPRRLVYAVHDAWLGLVSAARAVLGPFAGRGRRLTAVPRPRRRSAIPAVGTGAGAARPVAAVVHIFFPDLSAEIRGYLEQVPAPLDLFISTDSEAKRQAILDAFAGWDRGALEVRIAPNRGRDIAPKLVTFREVYARYDYVLHLHGKRSAHSAHLQLWRPYLYETLIGDPAAVTAILEVFDRTPSIGLIAAQHFYPVRPAVSWANNFALAQGLAARMGFEIRPKAPMDFPSGSMFWVRSAALRPLLDLDLKAEDFPPEAGQIDTTLAHAIERLYFYACEAAGFRWVKVARPAFAHPEDHGRPWRGRSGERPAILISDP